MRRSLVPLLAVLAWGGFVAPSPVGATSTGLNNIVTTDTPADGEVVVQVYSDFGSGRKPDHFAGLKTGLHRKCSPSPLRGDEAVQLKAIF
jgi:hypothetical protein